MCLTLLTDTVGPAAIGQAVGVIDIPMSLRPILEPLLGGVIYAHGGYYAVFELMFAMLSLNALLRLAMIERKVAQKWLEVMAENADTPNVHSKSDSPTSPTPCPPIRENEDKTDSELPHSSLILRHQLPPRVRLLLSSRMLVSLVGGLLQSSLNVAFDSTLPLVVNALFGWEQTGQGLIFITILLPSLLQPVFGAITDRYQQGRRLLAADDCLLAAPAFVLLRLVTQDTLKQKALLCALLVIIGLGMTIAMPAIIAEIGATVADAEKKDPQAIKRSAMATGWSLVNAAYAAGCLTGPLFAGLIRNKAGWQTTAWCLGLLSGVTSVFLLLFLGGWIGKLGPKALISRVLT